MSRLGRGFPQAPHILRANTVTIYGTCSLSAAAAANTPDVWQGIGSSAQALTADAAVTLRATLQPETLNLAALAAQTNHVYQNAAELLLAADTALSATGFLGGQGVASLSAAASLTRSITASDASVPGIAVPGIAVPGDGSIIPVTGPPNSILRVGLNALYATAATTATATQILRSATALNADAVLSAVAIQILRSTVSLSADAALSNAVKLFSSLVSLSAWADIDADLAVQKAVVNLAAAALIHDPNLTVGMAKALTVTAALTGNVTSIWSTGPKLTAHGELLSYVFFPGIKSMTAQADLSGYPAARAAHLDLAAIAAMADPNSVLSLPRNTTWLSADAALRSLVTRPGLIDLIAHSVLTSNHTLSVKVALSALADLSPRFMFRSYAAMEALADLTNKSRTGSTAALLSRAVLDAAAGKGSKASLTADALLHGLRSITASDASVPGLAVPGIAVPGAGSIIPVTGPDVIQGTKTELSSLTDLTARVSQGMHLQLKAEAATNTPDVTLFVTAPLIASALLESKVLLKSSAELTALAEIFNVPAIGSFSSLAVAAEMNEPKSLLAGTAELRALAIEQQLIQAIYDVYLKIVFDTLQSVSSEELELQWNVGAPMSHPRALTNESWISLMQSGRRLGQ